MNFLRKLKQLFSKPRAPAVLPRLDPEMFTPFPDGGYLVGGAVRDALLGRSTHDLDWLVSQPERTASLAANLLEGAAFALDEDRGHWRTVTNTTVRDYIRLDPPLEANLRERDFTINSIALAADGNLIDPTGGLEDLKRGLLRMNSVAVLRADPLRLLRGVRLATTLGFELEGQTRATISELAREQLAGELPLPAGERVREELDAILQSDNPGGGLQLAEQLGLLDVYLPELTAGRDIEQGGFHHRDVLHHQIEALQQLAHLFPEADLSLRWATLLHDIGKPVTREQAEDDRTRFYGHDKEGAELARRVMQRLRHPSARADRTAELVRRHMLPLPGSDRSSRRFVHRYRHVLPDLLKLMIADREAARGPQSSEATRNSYRLGVARIISLLDEVPAPSEPPLLDGRAIMKLLDLPEGPQVGQAVEYVAELAAVGDANTPEEAEKFLLEYAHAQGWLG